MVPKIHAKGSSFKGAAAYLLHDKDRAVTSDRVAWTETRNLAVDDPNMAWRIMAATALDQARLKADAGVKNTGRKSDKHVLHITLAWHPDQTPDREGMAKAADQALAAIGAEDRQAMIIAHSDEKHPHVHLLVNRVSPIDGRHLTQSNDRLKLSKWAESYEREHGQILCENRVVNNAMRDAGEYVKGTRDQARHIFEAQGQPANDNARDHAVRAEQRAKDHALSQRGRNMAKLHSAAWTRLEAAHLERKAAMARQLVRDVAKAKADIVEAFRPEWRELNRVQASERETFAALESSFFGRASNIVRTLKAGAQDIGGARTDIISRSFQILTNAGARKAYFEKAQEAARTALQRRQASQVAEAKQRLKAAQEPRIAALRDTYLSDRDHLAKSQAAESEHLKGEWQQRNIDRKAAFAKAREQLRLRKPTDPGQEPADRKPLSSYEQRLRARLMAEFEENRAMLAKEQNNERDRDDGQER